jgi:hypothetical protein
LTACHGGTGVESIVEDFEKVGSIPEIEALSYPPQVVM